MATRTRDGGTNKGRAAGKPLGGRGAVRAGGGAKTAAKALRGAGAAAPRPAAPAGLLSLLDKLPSGVAADVLRQAARAAAAGSGRAKARLVVGVEPAPDEVSRMRRRAFGVLRGRIRVPADFDDTPADLVAAMEGDGAAGRGG